VTADGTTDVALKMTDGGMTTALTTAELSMTDMTSMRGRKRREGEVEANATECVICSSLTFIRAWEEKDVYAEEKSARPP